MKKLSNNYTWLSLIYYHYNNFNNLLAFVCNFFF